MTSVPPQSPQQQPSRAAGPAKPDYTMAWLPHLLMLFTCFIGPLIIWLTQKDTNKYGAYHGKQAMFWVIGVGILYFVLWILMVAIIFVFAPLVFLPYCLMVLLALGNLAYVIYAIVLTSQGKPFKYVLVADLFCKKEFAAAYPNLPQG